MTLQRLTPFQRRWRRFYERLAQRRATWNYEPRDPFWLWDQQLHPLADDTEEDDSGR